MAQEPEIQIKSGIVENPTTKEVTIKKRPKTHVAGMEEVVVEDGKLPGYDLRFGVCTTCGEETAIKVHLSGREEFLGCPKCGSRDQSKFRQTEKTIYADQVAKIINRAVKYKDEHGKIHDNPFKDNVLNDYIVNKSNDWQRGFICTNCQRIYSKKVACCTDGKMVAGKFAPDPLGKKAELLGLNPTLPGV